MCTLKKSHGHSEGRRVGKLHFLSGGRAGKGGQTGGRGSGHLVEGRQVGGRRLQDCEPSETRGQWLGSRCPL